MIEQSTMQHLSSLTEQHVLTTFGDDRVGLTSKFRERRSRQRRRQQQIAQQARLEGLRLPVAIVKMIPSLIPILLSVRSVEYYPHPTKRTNRSTAIGSLHRALFRFDRTDQSQSRYWFVPSDTVLIRQNGPIAGPNK